MDFTNKAKRYFRSVFSRVPSVNFLDAVGEAYYKMLKLWTELILTN